MAFITGFPEDIAQKLQQVMAVEKMEVSELILTAKILTSSEPLKPAEVVEFSWKEEDQDKREEQMTFFECGRPHYQRNCRRYLSRTTCFKCNKKEHFTMNCLDQRNK